MSMPLVSSNDRVLSLDPLADLVLTSHSLDLRSHPLLVDASSRARPTISSISRGTLLLISKSSRHPQPPSSTLLGLSSTSLLLETTRHRSFAPGGRQLGRGRTNLLNLYGHCRDSSFETRHRSPWIRPSKRKGSRRLRSHSLWSSSAYSVSAGMDERTSYLSRMQEKLTQYLLNLS
jgi:hypothetical protein